MNEAFEKITLPLFFVAAANFSRFYCSSLRSKSKSDKKLVRVSVIKIVTDRNSVSSAESPGSLSILYELPIWKLFCLFFALARQHNSGEV